MFIDVSSTLSEIHGLMNSQQASNGGKNTMDGDVSTQFALSRNQNIDYYLDDSFVSTVMYLSPDTC